MLEIRLFYSHPQKGDILSGEILTGENLSLGRFWRGDSVRGDFGWGDFVLAPIILTLYEVRSIIYEKSVGNMTSDVFSAEKPCLFNFFCLFMKILRKKYFVFRS